MVAPRVPCAAAALLLLSAPALADGNIGATPPPKSLPPLEIFFGGHVAVTMGDRCTREASDMVACTSGAGLAGLHFGPGYRVLPRLVVGVGGAVSFSSESETWWQSTLNLRVHPFGEGYDGIWFGGGAGVVAIVEQLEADGLRPAEALTHTAPLFTLGGGANFTVKQILTVGPELRAFVVPFGKTDALPDRGSSYETQLGASLSFTATLLLGRPR